MTTPGHRVMAQPWKAAMNKQFHAPLEDQAKKKQLLWRQTREAEEPQDSPVVDNEGRDNPPLNLYDRAVVEATVKMLDKYKGGMERPLLTKRRKLILEANVPLETGYPEAWRQLQEAAGANGEAL